LNVGVISGDLMLSDQTPLGEWKIEVKAAVSFVIVVIPHIEACYFTE